MAKRRVGGAWVDPTRLSETSRRQVVEWLRNPFRDLKETAKKAGRSWRVDFERTWPKSVMTVIVQETGKAAAEFERTMGMRKDESVLEGEVVSVEKEAKALATGGSVPGLPEGPVTREGVISMIRGTLDRVNRLMGDTEHVPEQWMRVASAQLQILDRLAKSTGADKPEDQGKELLVFAGLKRDQTLKEWCEANGYRYSGPDEEEEEVA